MTRFARLSVLVLVGGCSWFTDFKEQPKIDPWDSPSDSVPPRGNPQSSVPVYGTSAPDFMYARTALAVESMSAIANPVAADSASLHRGRISYQINCAVCHGPLGAGDGPGKKYGLFPPPVVGASVAGRTDGYIFGIIRNGRGTMPSYNRIEETERWDIVNYIRALNSGATRDSSHGFPGETGTALPGASVTAPTRPAPYYNTIGSQAGAREGLVGIRPTTPAAAIAPAVGHTDTTHAQPGAAVLPPATQPGATTRPPVQPNNPPAQRPPLPEGSR